MNHPKRLSGPLLVPTERERELLVALSRGVSFTNAARLLGVDAVRVTFTCLQKGWINNGELTPEGRAAASLPARGNVIITGKGVVQS